MNMTKFKKGDRVITYDGEHQGTVVSILPAIKFDNISDYSWGYYDNGLFDGWENFKHKLPKGLERILLLSEYEKQKEETIELFLDDEGEYE